jgi:hypothetical protein
MDKIRYCIVKPGDQVYRILRKAYPHGFDKNREKLVGALLNNNPQIADINQIYPGQVIALSSASENSNPVGSISDQSIFLSGGEVNAANQITNSINLMSPVEVAFLSVFRTRILQAESGSFPSQVSRVVKESRPEIDSIVRECRTFKAGSQTRGQYDCAHKVSLLKMKKR